MSSKHNAASRLLGVCHARDLEYGDRCRSTALRPRSGRRHDGRSWGWGMGYGMGGFGGIGVLVLALVVLGIAVVTVRRRNT